MYIILMAILGICMIHDLRSKKIPAVWIWLCLLVASGYRVYGIVMGMSNVIEIFFSILPGIGILAVSYISKQIGNGDGLLIVAIGLYMGWKNMLEVLMHAFLMAAVVVLGYSFIKHNLKNSRIPFVPFLFMATGMQYIGALL